MSWRLRAVLVLALAYSACSNWDVVREDGGTHEGPQGSYTVTLPRGWVSLKGRPDNLSMTRDGLGLEQIVIFRRPNDKAFPRTKAKASPKLLPHELAELQLSEFKRESEVLAAATVIDMSPAKLGPRDGYRLHLSWVAEDGLPLVRLVYGLCDDKHYYMLGFEAPEIHYFAKHKPAFEAMAASFRLNEKR